MGRTSSHFPGMALDIKYWSECISANQNAPRRKFVPVLARQIYVHMGNLHSTWSRTDSFPMWTRNGFSYKTIRKLAWFSLSWVSRLARLIQYAKYSMNRRLMQGWSLAVFKRIFFNRAWVRKILVDTSSSILEHVLPRRYLW